MLIQITGNSLSSDSEQRQRTLAYSLLKDNLVDFIASDAHSANYRYEKFNEGLNSACKIIGFQKIKDIMCSNTKLIIENQKIDW
ncbi:CpsB/CapC family capsule biosynthesis tyrosine phosphatase, partial [Chlamydiota bacterium]